MNAPVKISVIIPTHNRCRLLKGTIQSLKEQSFPDEDYEIIVVDNASADNTREVVEECSLKGGKEVLYLREERLGLHHARHAGARAAKGEILAYTDDDAVYDENWLEQIFACYDGPEVGCAGGRVLPKWEARVPEWVKYFPSSLSLYDWGDRRRELKWPESIYGVNFSIRRDLLFKLGGFNPELFGDRRLGDGEVGLVRKVYAAGLKVIYNPEGIAWHVIPESRLTADYFKRRYANQGASKAYTDYKENRPGVFGLVMRSIKCTLKGMAHTGLAGWYQVAGTERFYWHWFSSYSQFHRVIYYFRLICDSDLRSLAEKEDWINE